MTNIFIYLNIQRHMNLSIKLWETVLLIRIGMQH
jgi:hypothetical protein